MTCLAGRRVLLVVSGGISAYKAPMLLRALQAAGAEVRCVMTACAMHFVSREVLAVLSGHPVACELFEQGTVINHIALADWAEVVLVAPGTANLLARMVAGLCDDLPSTLLLATRAPLVVAPAMNCNMYAHPATQHNLAVLRERGVWVVEADAGELACGVVGRGRQPAEAWLVEAVVQALTPQLFFGQEVLISAGSTREYLDAVRFIANPSSGKMGLALARAALRMGAVVRLVRGVDVAVPAWLRLEEDVAVESVEAMRQALAARASTAQWLFMSAAVGDWRVPEVYEKKRKKDVGEVDEQWPLTLIRTVDILAEQCRWRQTEGRRTPIMVGFAAETHDLQAHAQAKLVAKGCDVVLANWVRCAEGDAFGGDGVELFGFGAGGWRGQWGPGDKVTVAMAVLRDLAAHLAPAGEL